jgi:hypothetical protein
MLTRVCDHAIGQIVPQLLRRSDLLGLPGGKSFTPDASEPLRRHVS